MEPNSKNASKQQKFSIDYSDKRFTNDMVFNAINKKFTTLKTSDKQRNNAFIRELLETFCKLMTEKDELFKASWKNEIVFCGSYYKGLKHSKPDEYDTNIVINLPLIQDTIQISGGQPGRVTLKLREDSFSPKFWNHKMIKKNCVTDDLFLDVEKFRNWMKGVMNKTLRELDKAENGAYILVVGSKEYLISNSDHGPALTISISSSDISKLDIDMVPVLRFQQPLPTCFRKFDTTKPYFWTAVPKPLTKGGIPRNATDSIHWIVSRYSEEKELTKGQIKPIIRQMKKFRDNNNLKSIASYFIETIFYHELEERKNDPNFHKATNSQIFFNMLKKFHESCLNRAVFDYWDRRNYNLIEKIKESELENITCRLQRIIKTIDTRITEDKFIMAQYILSSQEFKELKEDFENIPNTVPVETPKLFGWADLLGMAIPAVLEVLSNHNKQSSSEKKDISKTEDSSEKPSTSVTPDSTAGSPAILSAILQELREMKSMIKSLESRLTNLETKNDSMYAVPALTNQLNNLQMRNVTFSPP